MFPSWLNHTIPNQKESHVRQWDGGLGQQRAKLFRDPDRGLHHLSYIVSLVLGTEHSEIKAGTPDLFGAAHHLLNGFPAFGGDS